MQEQLQVSLIQADLIWENKIENRNRIEQKIKAISNSDIVILPEMFTTGFSMNPKLLAETMEGETVLWMKKLAVEKNILLIGSVIIEENQHFFNRLISAFPDGTIQYYDKKHLFTLANEDHFYTAGKKSLLINFKGWKLFPLICYDLRFPVWARNTVDYDVLIYIASWPKQRVFAWDTLLKARAIENISYTIGVNRVGLDANNFEYSGHSVVLNPYGEELISAKENTEEIVSVLLDKTKLLKVRNKLQFLNDKDSFTIE